MSANECIGAATLMVLVPCSNSFLLGCCRGGCPHWRFEHSTHWRFEHSTKMLPEPAAKRQCIEPTAAGPAAVQVTPLVALAETSQPVGAELPGLLPVQDRQQTALEDGTALRSAEGLSGATAGPGPSSIAAAAAGQAQPQQLEAKAPASGAYSQREEALIKREADGDVSFRYVYNDDTAQNLIYLIGLKNIFSKQLPNMPKEYIVRLVMDRRHRSVALVKRSGTVVGGITYRAFHQQAFGEIAFCAVTSNEQVKGYGTRLMNHTKEAARTKDKLTHFLTYADNNAVGYFEKQGFTKEISLEKERWQGYIKDYDGGTLMECVMHPKISYTNFPSMLREQRLALDVRIRQVSNSHIVQKGLAHFQQEPRTQIPIGSIPGVREAGWHPAMNPPPRYKLVVDRHGGVRDVTPDDLHAFMTNMLEHIKRLEESWPFRDKVSVLDAPDYYDVIKDPMSLDVMTARLESRAFYLTLDIFNADLRKIVDNCRTYNAPDTVYYKTATKLEASANQYLATHLVFEDGPVETLGGKRGP